MKRITFGSHNSLDIDVVYLFNKLPTLQECKIFCSEKEENRNIVVIEDGCVIQSYKGTIDEMNNVILDTFNLHKQELDTNPITKRLERDVYLKNIRTIRGLLSQLSRTQYREIIKAALKGTWKQKISALEKIDLTKIEDFGKTSLIEAYKFIAFQLGQTMALVKGVEVYTKDGISNLYPSLKPYLQRIETDLYALQKTFDEYVKYLKSLKIKELENECIEIWSTRYDLKKEIKLPKMIECHMCGHIQEEKIQIEKGGSAIFGLMDLYYMSCSKCEKTIISFSLPKK